MAANSWRTWIRRWWFWILLGLTIGLYVLSRILPRGDDERKTLFTQARAQAKTMRAAAEARVEKIDEQMEGRRRELAEIKKIENDKLRRTRLAIFARRRDR